MTELDEATWAEIRRLYETSDLSVREISLRFNTTLSRIYERRTAENWPLRSLMTPEAIAAAEARYARGVAQSRNERAPSAGRPQPCAATGGAGSNTSEIGGGKPPAPVSKRSSGKRNGKGARYGRPIGMTAMQREELLSRMVRLAERNLAIMEQHMESENGHTTAEERERSTRTVGALVKTLEKVTELNPGNDVASDPSQSANVEATAELRRELAERIYRMWGGAKR